MAMPAIWAVVRGTGFDRCIGRLVAEKTVDRLDAEGTDVTVLELGAMTVVAGVVPDVDLIVVFVEVGIIVIVMLLGVGVTKFRVPSQIV